MKPILTISLLILLAGYTACASTESAADNSQTELEQARPQGSISDDSNLYQNLADYLQKVPGVVISGQTVTIRGVNSFYSNIEPLYVIDGQPVGTSYSQVNNMLNVNDIDYVRVLKGSDAAIYGVRGGNGVVLIVMRK